MDAENVDKMLVGINKILNFKVTYIYFFGYLYKVDDRFYKHFVTSI